MALEDYEAATVKCDGGHDASIVVSQSYDTATGPEIPSVAGAAAKFAEACGWQQTADGWRCVLCVQKGQPDASGAPT